MRKTIWRLSAGILAIGAICLLPSHLFAALSDGSADLVLGQADYFHGGNSSAQNEFYEMEPALVLDIILDKNHPYFKNKPFTLSNEKWPEASSSRQNKT